MILLKLIYEAFAQALYELWSNKLRTFLSLLGIAIGIFCIISVQAVFNSMEKSIKQNLRKLGDDVVVIEKWPWTFTDPNYAWWEFWKRPNPDLQELKIIKSQSQLAENVALAMDDGGNLVKYERYSLENVNLNGVTQEYGNLIGFEIEEGRYFSELESNNGSAICVIGNDIANNLFPVGTDVIGKKVNFKGYKASVIGILKKEGQSVLGESNDIQIFYPYKYARKFMPKNEETQIWIRPKASASIDQLKDELTGIMRAQRRLKPKQKDNFALNQMSMLSDMLETMFKSINMVGWIIGGFSLIVGAFSIAFIMFVAVKERTRQIGIKKAIGATWGIIMFEFLIESVILCLLGCALGLGIILTGTAVYNATVEAFPINLDTGNIVLAVTIAVSIGVIAGLVPALIAAMMKPVNAIRS